MRNMGVGRVAESEGLGTADGDQGTALECIGRLEEFQALGDNGT
jgi:hypothetical protein